MNNIYEIVVLETDLATSVSLYGENLSIDDYNCSCLLASATARQLKVERVRVGKYLYIYGSRVSYHISGAGKDLIAAYDDAILCGNNSLAEVKAHMADSGVILPCTVTIERIEEKR